MKLPKNLFFMMIGTDLAEDMIQGNFVHLMKLSELTKGFHRIPKVEVEEDDDNVIIRFPSLESIIGLYADLPNAYKPTIYIDEEKLEKMSVSKEREILEWLKTCELTKIGFEFDAAPQFDPI
jgi:hypothetical protein